MKRQPKSKVLALLMALLLAFQLLPMGVARADTPGRDIGKTPPGEVHAYVHDSDGTPDFPESWYDAEQVSSKLKSSIRIETKNSLGNWETQEPELDGEGKQVYKNITANSKATVSIAFHIELPPSEAFINGDYFDIKIPTNVTFNKMSGDFKNSSNEKFGEWKMLDPDHDTIRVTLTDVTKIVDYVRGVIDFTGTFNYLNAGDPSEEKTEIQFGSQTIVIERVPAQDDHEPLKDSTVTKSDGKYDPEKNEITWEVSVTRPAGEAAYGYDSYQLRDTLSGNHAFKGGSFEVWDGTQYSAVSTGLVVALDEKSFTYTFPTGSASPQKVRYITNPRFEPGNKTNTFSNTVRLYDEKGTLASNQASGEFKMGKFFTKTSPSAVLEDAVTKERYVKWDVTVTLPKTEGYTFTFKDAYILDTLLNAAGIQHTLISNSAVTVNGAPVDMSVKVNGTSVSSTASTDKGSYKIDSTNNKLYYYLTDDEATTSNSGNKVLTLTYYTRVNDWDVSSTNNGELQAKNQAEFFWTYPTGEGNGPWLNGIGTVGVNKPVVFANGLLAKSTTDTKDFDHTAQLSSQQGDYIQWTIIVNNRKTELTNDENTFSITDTLSNPAYHTLAIDAAHPLTVTKGSASTPYNLTTGTSETDSLGTLDKISDSQFTFTFPQEKMTETYTIVYYTKVTQAALDFMYTANSIQFKNSVTLNGYGTNVKVENVTKTYNLQMLAKDVATAYDYADRKVQWRLTVNRNHLDMTNPVITDYLPKNMELTSDKSKNGSDGVFMVSVNGAAAVPIAGAGITMNPIQPDANGRIGFELVLPSISNDTNKYEFTYWAKLTDDALLADNTTVYTNDAYLSMEELGHGPQIHADKATTVKNTVVSKSYVNNTDDFKNGIIHWSVEINPGQIDLKSAVIRDVLIDVLALDVDSVALWRAAVSTDNGNSKLTQGSPVDIVTQHLLTTGIVEVDGRPQKYFDLSLPDGPQAYILKFDTTIQSTNSATISNSISLSGTTSSPTGTSTVQSFTVNELYSGASTGSGKITVTKLSENDQPMANVGFKLYVTNGTYRTSSTTAAGTGKAVFSNLPGWYFYVEEDATTTPNGYLAIAGPIGHVRATPTGGEITVKNQIAKASVQIAKKGAGGADLNGGTFTLTGTSAYNNSTYTISNVEAVNGEVSFGNVPIGTYTITETAAPAGHKLAEIPISIPVTVTYVDDTKTSVKVTYGSSNAASYTLVNEPILTEANAKVSFTKTDDQGNPIVEKAGIDGGTFTLTGTNDAGTIADIVKSVDAAGLVDFGKLTVGTYKITETSAPAGYLNLTSKDIFNVTVSYTDGNHNDLKVTMTPISPNEARYVADSKQFKNTPAVGDVTFTKKDSANDAIKINGGTFVIYGTSLGGQSVSIEAHAVNNVVTFKDVPVGDDYTIKETVPPSGYFLTNKTLTGVKVVYTDIHKTAVQNVDLTTDPNFILTNDLIPYVPGEGKATVTKVDADGKVLAGATFTLYDSNGKAVASMTTGDDGLATFTKLKPYSSYTIKETAAPTGYDLSSEVLTVTTKDRSVLTFTMVNKKSEVKLGSASILKTDADGKKLPGATFTLYDGDGKAVATAVTGSDGLAVFKDLVPGKAYTVKETMAPIGYQLSSEVLTLNVTPGAALSFTVLNKRLDEAGKGDVRILKTDAEGAALGGATFTLYDAEGRAVASATSGSDGGVTFSGIPANASYTIKETAAPSGYLLSGEVLSIQLTAGQVATYTVVNRKSDVPGTTPVLGSLSIMKVNSAKAPLAGAEFTVYAADGKMYASTVTGADGIARFTGLPLGRYAVVETRAPQGYRLFTGTHAVTLTETSPNLSFTLRNASDSEKPETAGWEEIDETPVPGGPGTPGSTPVTPNGNLPKTGEIPMSFYLLLVGLSLLGAGLVTALPRKKGRKHLDHSKKD